MKENAIVYFSAIDMSITASQAGASFADDAISLCEAIVDEAPLSSIITFIEDMQQVAKQARSDAQDMFDKFRSVRRGFFNVHDLVIFFNRQLTPRYVYRSQIKYRKHPIKSSEIHRRLRRPSVGMSEVDLSQGLSVEQHYRRITS